MQAVFHFMLGRAHRGVCQTRPSLAACSVLQYFALLTLALLFVRSSGAIPSGLPTRHRKVQPRKITAPGQRHTLAPCRLRSKRVARCARSTGRSQLPARNVRRGCTTPRRAFLHL